MKRFFLIATLFLTSGAMAAPAISGVDPCKLLTLAELQAVGVKGLRQHKIDKSLSDKDEVKAPSDVRTDMCTYYVKDGELSALAFAVVESFAPQVSGQAVSAWLLQSDAESIETPAEERKRFGDTTCESGHYRVPSIDGKSTEANQAFISCSRRVGKRHLLVSLQSSTGASALPDMDKVRHLLDLAGERLKKAGKVK